MHRTVWLGTGTVVLLTALLVAAAAAPHSAVRSANAAQVVMDADQRLQRPVTLAWADHPLGEALPELGKQLGVPLSADSSVANDQITFFGKGRPAVEVLTQIAEHFGFQWRRQEEGYQLWQDLAGQQREAGLRQAEVQDLLRQVAEHQQRVEAAARLTPEARATQKAALQQRLSEGKLSRTEQEQVTAEMSALEGVTAPFREIGGEILNGLTPVQVRQLAEGQTLRLTTADGSLAPQFGKRIGDALAAMDGGDSKPLTAAGLALRVGDDLGPPMADPDDMPWTPTRLPLRFEGWINSSYTLPSGGKGSRGSNWLPLRSRMSLEVLEAPPDDPALLREVVILPRSQRRVLKLSQVAERIHAATGLPILADSFVRARVGDMVLAGKKPLYHTLQYLEQWLQYRWELQDGVLRLRSALFYRDRPREIPLPLRVQWRERLASQGFLSLDDLGKVASTLGDEQLRSLSGYWYWQLETPAATGTGSGFPPKSDPPVDLVARRHDLRLWNSLNGAQQATARKGLLPLRGLNGLQQRLALAAFVSPAREPSPQMPPLAPPLAQFIAGGFSVAQEATQIYRYVVQNEDGRNSTQSITVFPGHKPPNPPELAEGDRLSRKILAQDRIVFRYSLPGSESPAASHVLSIGHPAKLVK